MRRRCTSFLIAALLAAATWACDQAAPTSPTPQAVVGVDGLAASAVTATGSQGAAGAVILGMKAPCEEGDTRPQCKDKGDDDVTLEATITFGGLTATTKQKTYSADESDIHVELMSEFDISLVIDIKRLVDVFYGLRRRRAPSLVPRVRIRFGSCRHRRQVRREQGRWQEGRGL